MKSWSMRACKAGSGVGKLADAFMGSRGPCEYEWECMVGGFAGAERIKVVIKLVKAAFQP